MGCLAIALSIFFRLKSRALNGLPKNLSANVFDKTFVVFNPYSEQRKIIHGFLYIIFLLLLLLVFTCLGFSVIVWKILESGLLLSLFILLIGLNLIIVEDAIEIYQNSNTFIKAVQGGTNLGVGDLKGFQILKNALPRITQYYLGLSILFMALSLAVPHIWSSALWFVARFMGSILEVAAPAGVLGYQVAVCLFALTLVIIQIFASKIKNKLTSQVLKSEIK